MRKPSLKLTCSPLKNDGFSKFGISLISGGYFKVRAVSFREGKNLSQEMIECSDMFRTWHVHEKNWWLPSYGRVPLFWGFQPSKNRQGCCRCCDLKPEPWLEISNHENSWNGESRGKNFEAPQLPPKRPKIMVNIGKYTIYMDPMGIKHVFKKRTQLCKKNVPPFYLSDDIGCAQSFNT